MSSAEIGTARNGKALDLGELPGWLWLGIGVYALLLIDGSPLLNDPDTFWHIAVGQWILDHGALPRVDIYSFTKIGEAWISTSWLAEVVLAKAFGLAGWSGPVILTALAAATTFALLASILSCRIPATHAIAIAGTAFVLTAPHLLARPHVLTYPVLLLWAHGLLQASERRKPPSFRLLPLMTLWANLHGGFVLGLALVGAFACDALWNADASERKPLAIRWLAFGAAALAMSCITPYGWDSILASRRILGLGELLHLIDEWRPANFDRLTPFELIVLAAIGATLYSGARLSPPRIVLVLGLFHMALSHVRNVEILAVLTPLAVMTPVAAQFELARFVGASRPAVAAAGLVAALGLLSGVFTWAFAANGRYCPPALQSQATAVEALEAHHAKRILNDLSFAGYLISQHIPVFIDGRAELYGEHFGLACERALQLEDVNGFLDLLKSYDVDAVLLTPETPAASLLDHISGWKRIYSDNSAVVHVRTGN